MQNTETTTLNRLLADIVSFLPEWTVFRKAAIMDNPIIARKSDDFSQIMLRPTMGKLSVFTITSELMRTAQPGFHAYHSGSAPDNIQVSASRDARAIANDIARRLIPAHEAYIGRLRHEIAAHAEKRRVQLAGIRHAAVVFGYPPAWKEKLATLETEPRMEGWGNFHVNNVGEVKVNFDGSGASVDVFLRADEYAEFLKFYHALTAKRTT